MKQLPAKHTKKSIMVNINHFMGHENLYFNWILTGCLSFIRLMMKL